MASCECGYRGSGFGGWMVFLIIAVALGDLIFLIVAAILLVVALCAIIEKMSAAIGNRRRKEQARVAEIQRIAFERERQIRWQKFKEEMEIREAEARMKAQEARRVKELTRQMMQEERRRTLAENREAESRRGYSLWSLSMY